MNIEEVREFAGAVGILLVNRYQVKDDLIRIIQMSMGRDACYGMGASCQKGKCEWSEECLGKKILAEKKPWPNM